MLIKLAFRNLFRNPRRASTVLLTVALGSASIFIFRGFNTSIMNQYREGTIHARYGNGQINTKGYRDQVYEKPWEHWMSDPSSIEKQLLQVPGVTHVFPRIEFFALLTNGKINVSGRGQGVEGVKEADFFKTLNVEQGVTLSEQQDGILIGKGLAKTLDVKVGDTVTVLANTIYGSMNGIDAHVVGIFHTGTKEYDDAVFRIQLSQAQKLLDTQKVESIAIGLNAVNDWKNVASAVASRFPQLEATPFEILDKVYYQNSVDWLDSQFAVTQTIILFIVILGIFNTVSTSILERKQEIGNLRANGESVSDIMKLLSLEGVALGLTGALLGIISAFVLNLTVLKGGILMPPAPGLTRQFHIRIELQPLMGIISFTLGAITAIIGTTLAGIKVAKMPIGDALRAV